MPTGTTHSHWQFWRVVTGSADRGATQRPAKVRGCTQRFSPRKSLGHATDAQCVAHSVIDRAKAVEPVVADRLDRTPKLVARLIEVAAPRRAEEAVLSKYVARIVERPMD